MKDATYCPICRKHIQKTVENLAQTAQRAMFNNHEEGEDAPAHYDDEVDDESNESFCSKMTEEQAADKSEVLTKEILSLKPHQPTKVFCLSFFFCPI